MGDAPEFVNVDEEARYLASKAFQVIELVEVAGVEGVSFDLIRKRLLNLGNDILRMCDKLKVGGR